MAKYIMFFWTLTMLTTNKIYSQQPVVKNLYYYQDDPIYQNCGTIQEAGILFFVADTLKKRQKQNEFIIAVMCPNVYGDNFFRKGNRYKLTLNKNFDTVKKYIAGDAYEVFKKKRNFWVAKKIISL